MMDSIILLTGKSILECYSMQFGSWNLQTSLKNMDLNSSGPIEPIFDYRRSSIDLNKINMPSRVTALRAGMQEHFTIAVDDGSPTQIDEISR
jgi:hypothetical protein